MVHIPPIRSYLLFLGLHLKSGLQTRKSLAALDRRHFNVTLDTGVSEGSSVARSDSTVPVGIRYKAEQLTKGTTIDYANNLHVESGMVVGETGLRVNIAKDRSNILMVRCLVCSRNTS